MKKRLVSIYLLCCLLLSLAACGEVEQHEQSKEYPQVSEGSIYMIHGDTVFYYAVFDNNPSYSIKYQDINNVSDEGRPLLDDPLLEDELNPFTNMLGLTLMAVDYEATEKNGGMPVLIITYSIGFNHYTIVSFNTKTNEIKTIKDDIYDNVQSLHVYGDIIYYTVNRGNKGYDMCQVGTNGKNDSVKDNPYASDYRISTVYEDKIYYLSDSKAYTCNLDFSEQTLLVDSIARYTAFIHDGYFYYASGLKYRDIGNFTSISETVSRFPLSDPSATEVFIEDITWCVNFGSKLFYCESAPRLFGDVKKDEGTNVLRVMDLDTRETAVVYDRGDDTALNMVEGISDSWIYCSRIDYAPKLTDPSAQEIYTYSVINTETFEEIILPR